MQIAKPGSDSSVEESLRNRAREWATLSEWLRASHGETWPGNVGRILRYLEERHEIKPIGKSVPKALLASVSLLETIGQVAPDARFSCDPILVETVRSWTADLEAAPGVRQAPLYTIAIMLSMELLLAQLLKLWDCGLWHSVDC